MENTELLAKIKAEIERRTKELDEQIVDIYDSKAVLRKDELQKLLSFLSTLESEKPINPEDAMKELDEKIALVKQRGTWDGVDVDKYMDEVRGREPEKPMNPDGLEEEINRYLREECSDDDEPSISDIARHFAQWGAEQTLHKVEQWVEKNTCRYIDTQNDEEGYIKEVFLDNAFVDDLKKGMKKIFAKWRAEHFVEK